MPNILAIDTSNALCSVALNCSGRIAVRVSTEARQHARQLLPMVQSLMAEQTLGFADLQAVAFVSGPGSFTGLRIGTGVVQGLAFAAGLPVLPVSSLAVMAASALQRASCEQVFVSLQAREGEIYGAVYTRAGEDVALSGEESVGPVCAFLPRLRALDGDICLAGDVNSVLEALKEKPLSSRIASVVSDCPSDAVTLGRLAALRLARGLGVEPMQAQPVYVKEQMEYRE